MILSILRNILACSAVMALLYSVSLASNHVAEDMPLAVIDILREGEKITRFQVEVATTDEQLQRGLMYRQELPRDKGMLFLYHTPRDASLWMKNTFIPLDMLFVDEKDQIIHIHENAEPLDTTPIRAGRAVQAVVEIAGGQAKSQDIRVGDILVFAEETH